MYFLIDTLICKTSKKTCFMEDAGMVYVLLAYMHQALFHTTLIRSHIVSFQYCISNRAWPITNWWTYR